VNVKPFSIFEAGVKKFHDIISKKAIAPTKLIFDIEKKAKPSFGHYKKGAPSS